MRINENSIEEFEELPHEEFIRKNFLKFIKTVKKEEIPEDYALFLMSFWFAEFMSKKSKLESFKHKIEAIYQLVKSNENYKNN